MSNPKFGISSTQKHLVVTVNQTSIDLMCESKAIETALHKPAIDVATLVMEIGEGRENTPELFVDFFDKHMPKLLDAAFEDECELIYFYLDSDLELG